MYLTFVASAGMGGVHSGQSENKVQKTVEGGIQEDASRQLTGTLVGPPAWVRCVSENNSRVCSSLLDSCATICFAYKV